MATGLKGGEFAMSRKKEASGSRASSRKITCKCALAGTIKKEHPCSSGGILLNFVCPNIHMPNGPCIDIGPKGTGRAAAFF